MDFPRSLLPGVHSWLQTAAMAASLLVLQGFGPAVWVRGAGTERDGYRTLARGVLTEIPPDDSTGALSAKVDVPALFRGVDVRNWTPELSPGDRTLLGQFRGPGKGTPPGYEVQRDVWCLSFAYKPPRLIDVDVPTAGLRMQRRRLWYLVYRVRNEGGFRLGIDPADPAKREPERIEMPVRFLPLFVLESSQSLSPSEGLTSYRSYTDRAVPTAIAAIEKRERLGTRLLDSVAMARKEIEPGEERWGVAVWENVHPDIQFFSIVATGLTNRFQFRPPAAGEQEGSVALESLRLDFWHRGDERDPAEAEIGIGYAGLFERVTLGTRILECVNRVDVSKAAPEAGLAALGLSWEAILEPSLSAADAVDRTVPVSLEPLAKVIDAIAKVEAPSDRAKAVRDLFGDAGSEAFEEVVRSVMAPADPDRTQARRAALDAIGIGETAFDTSPLEGLAKLVRGLDRIRPTANRNAAEKAVFGDALARFNALGRGLAAARSVAVLDQLGLDRAVLSTLGPRPLFDRVREQIDAVRGAGEGPDDAEIQSRLAAGLFGAEGPLLFAAATARHQGIDHEWFFRYESVED